MEPRTFKLKDGEILCIREATSDDASSLLMLIDQVSTESDYLTFSPGEFEHSKNEEAEFFEAQKNSANQIYIIALIDKEIIGLLNFSARNRKRIRHSGEFSMAVSKKYWGLGVGSILVDCLIDWAKSTKIIKKINLRVRTDNIPAIRIYEKRGFEKEGNLQNEILIDGKYYDLFWMGLDLS